MLMKKLLCLVGALFAVLMVNAQKADDPRPVSTDHPYGFISKEDLMKLEKMVPESPESNQTCWRSRGHGGVLYGGAEHHEELCLRAQRW